MPLARWKCSSRSVPTRSPATRQQMHPPASVTMFSLDDRTSAWSMATPPHSLMMTAVSAKRASRSRALRSVVLPLPRNPVSTVTDVTRASPMRASRPLFLRLGAARARMRGVVDLGEVLEIEVRVDLGRGDARMPEHLLDGAQVARGLQHVRSERMPQHVRVHVDVESRVRGPALDALLHLARREPPARSADE